ncbi:MAG TPA: putative Ig domain-containing protein [Solirubrobacteraceae bacterium]
MTVVPRGPGRRPRRRPLTRRVRLGMLVLLAGVAGQIGVARADVFASQASTLALPGGLGAPPNVVVAGDLNGDGRQDLAVAGSSASGGGAVSLLTGMGGGLFTTHTPDDDGSDPLGAAEASLDGDAFPDLVLAGIAPDQLVLLFGDAGLGYDRRTSIPLPGRPSDVAVADLNGDGLPDIAVTDRADDELLLFLATAPGVYPPDPQDTLTTGGSPTSVAIADLNGDRTPDLVVTNQTGNSVSLYLSQPTGSSYTTKTLSTGSPSAPAAAAIGDLNGDGLPDLAVIDSAANDVDNLTVFTQSSTGGFASSTMPAGSTPSAIVIGDLNGDGLPDIAVANKLPNTVTVFEKDAADSRYTPSSLPVSGSGPVSLTLGELTGDGKPDLVTANGFSGDLTLFTQVPPAAPVFTADSPPAGEVGAGYAYAFDTSGRPTATFAVATGALPDGLSLDPKSGLLSGTPTAAGSFTFTVKADNGVGAEAATPAMTVVVSGKAAAPVFTADSPPASATANVSYAYQFAASGAPAQMTYTIDSGSVPSGLAFGHQVGSSLVHDGELNGTPGAPGSYTFTVRASNGVGPDAVSPPITIVVTASPAAPVFNDDSPPATAPLGGLYSYTFEASGGVTSSTVGPSYVVTPGSGSLPPGLSLNPGLGLLSGRPTATGSFTFTVSAQNGQAPDAVSPPITIVVPVTPAAPLLDADTPDEFPDAGTGYSYTFVASGNPAPTYSVASGSLPGGLSLDPASGMLSGTLPSSPESATFTVAAGNGSGSPAVSQPITITVAGFTAAAPPDTAALGSPFSYAFAAVGSPDYYFASGAPPDGLSLDSASGVLSGTPTSAGTFTFAIDAAGGGGGVISRPVTITVPAGPPTAPAFTADSPPSPAEGGVAYSYSLTASGAPAPNFSVASGSLPPGLRLASFTGLLSGVPTAPGTYTFELGAGNGVGAGAVSAPVTITVTSGALAVPALTSDAPSAAGTVGSPYAYGFAASGNPAPAFGVASGALPDGLGLDPGSGMLSGTPAKAGTFTFTVKASNGVTPDALSGQLTIVVSPAPAAPVFTAAIPPATATVGSAYSYTYAASGYPAPAFAVTSGALPAGLSLDGATGVLSGTPTAAGSFSSTVGAANGVGQAATSGQDTITVVAAPALTAASPPATATVGTAYSYTFVASGSPAPTFVVASGSLPAGLGLDPTSGVLSGAPTTATAATFTVKATNGVAPDALSAPITITVTVGPAPPPAELGGPLGPTSPQAAAKPSNAIRFTSVRTEAKGVLALRLRLPGRGHLLIRATATVPGKKAKHAKKAPKAKKITYAAAISISRSGPGVATVTLKPAKTAATALKVAKRLRVLISVTFTPTGGSARTQTGSVTATYAVR